MTYSEADLRELAKHTENENEPRVRIVAEVAASAVAIIDALRQSTVDGSWMKEPVSMTFRLSRLEYDSARTDIAKHAEDRIRHDLSQHMPITFVTREDPHGFVPSIVIEGRFEDWRKRAAVAEERVRHLEAVLGLGDRERFADLYLGTAADEEAPNA